MIIENPLSRKDRKSLGNVIYYEMYGHYILRTKPLVVNDPKTPAEQASRMRFKKVILLTRQVYSHIKAAYDSSMGGRCAFSHTVSINKKNCFVDNTTTIDPSLFKLCENDGSFVSNVALTSNDLNTITSTFDSNAQNDDEGADPVKAYGLDVDGNKIWQFEQAAIRSTSTITHTQPDMSGLQIAVYFECLDKVNLLMGKPRHVIKYVGTVSVI